MQAARRSLLAVGALDQRIDDVAQGAQALVDVRALLQRLAWGPTNFLRRPLIVIGLV